MRDFKTNLLGSKDTTNFVEYDGQIYAVEQGVGTVDLNSDEDMTKVRPITDDEAAKEPWLAPSNE